MQVPRLIQGLIVAAFVTTAATGAARAVDPEITRIALDRNTLEERRLTGKTGIDVPAGSALEGGAIKMRIQVDTAGKVIAADARPEDEDRRDHRRAIDAAMAWRFRPTTWNGKPVEVVADVWVSYDVRLPDGPRTAFPDITSDDWEIELERGLCMGSCPAYKVTVHGNGRVDLASTPWRVGEAPRGYRATSIIAPGTHHATVSRAEARQLLERFRAARFMTLKDNYVSDGATDLPGYTLRFRHGGDSKQVYDYLGGGAGMPDIVNELQAAVDKAAGTQRWIGGTAETIPALEAEGLEVGSPAGQQLMLDAILSDIPDPSIVDLLDRTPDLALLGAGMAQTAAEQGRLGVLDRLQALGFPPPIGPEALFVKAKRCDLDMAAELVRRGVDPAARDETGNTILINGLYELRQWGDCDGKDGVAFLRAMLKLGVPINAQNTAGQTALFFIDDQAVLRAALEAGADPKLRAADGTTATLAVESDVGKLRLMKAGGNPDALNDWDVLREQAEEGLLPGTIQWIDGLIRLR